MYLCRNAHRHSLPTLVLVRPALLLRHTALLCTMQSCTALHHPVVRSSSMLLSDASALEPRLASASMSTAPLRSFERRSCCARYNH